uniref:Uncharacterized protein n=1 Tax=Cryptosporidium parvum TaxID=5807 RepID=F0X5D4_CRYPV
MGSMKVNIMLIMSRHRLRSSNIISYFIFSIIHTVKSGYTNLWNSQRMVIPRSSQNRFFICKGNMCGGVGCWWL